MATLPGTREGRPEGRPEGQPVSGEVSSLVFRELYKPIITGLVRKKPIQSPSFCSTVLALCSLTKNSWDQRPDTDVDVRDDICKEAFKILCIDTPEKRHAIFNFMGMDEEYLADPRRYARAFRCFSRRVQKSDILCKRVLSDFSEFLTHPDTRPHTYGGQDHILKEVAGMKALVDHIPRLHRVDHLAGKMMTRLWQIAVKLITYHLYATNTRIVSEETGMNSDSDDVARVSALATQRRLQAILMDLYDLLWFFVYHVVQCKLEMEIPPIDAEEFKLDMKSIDQRHESEFDLNQPRFANDLNLADLIQKHASDFLIPIMTIEDPKLTIGDLRLAVRRLLYKNCEDRNYMRSESQLFYIGVCTGISASNVKSEFIPRFKDAHDLHAHPPEDFFHVVDPGLFSSALHQETRWCVEQEMRNFAFQVGVRLQHLENSAVLNQEDYVVPHIHAFFHRVQMCSLRPN